MKNAKITKLFLTGIATVFMFIGCTPIGAPEKPKIYTGKATAYRDYYFIKKDPASGEVFTADKIVQDLTKPEKWGGLLALRRVYVQDKLYPHGYSKEVSFTDKYLIGKVKVYCIKSDPDAYDKCEVTFKKPYTLTEKNGKWDLRVAYDATYINISKGCLNPCLTGGYCMAINNWSPDEIKNEINKLPVKIVLENKYIIQTGVFNTKNSKDVILANLNRKFKKRKYFREALDNKVLKFLRNNNLHIDNFKHVYYVRNKYGAIISIAIHIDPTSKGSRVYYLASDSYTIESDGIPHTTKEEFENVVKKFIKTVNL
jgi:hypothetical protein